MISLDFSETNLKILTKQLQNSRLTIHLFTNNVQTSIYDTVSTFTEPVAAGYHRIELIPSQWIITADTATYKDISFFLSEANIKIYGFFIQFFDLGKLFYAERLDNAPIIIQYVGAEIKINIKFKISTTSDQREDKKMKIWLFDSTPGNRQWTCKKDGTYLVQVVGGGGGGAKSSNQSRGGDGGGYSAKYFTFSKGESFNYIVGMGGIDGNQGQASSFSSIIIATGGAGGDSPQSPGVGSNGDINNVGGNGNVLGGGGACGSFIGKGGNGFAAGGGCVQDASNNSPGLAQGDIFNLGSDYMVGNGGIAGTSQTEPENALCGGGGGRSAKNGVAAGQPGLGGGGACSIVSKNLSTNGGNGFVIITEI